MTSIVTTFCSLTLVILVLGQSDASKITKIFYDIENHVQLFEDFLKEQNKSYEGKEYYRRINIFKKRLQEINELNKQSQSSVYGIDFFTDLTDEERKQYTGFLSSNIPTSDFSCTTVQYTNKTEVPETLDYRSQDMVTPVVDQMTCGSCYAFGTVGAIEGQYAKKHKQLLSLSKQQIVDCSKNKGCKGGWPDVAYSYVHSEGLALETDYPYIAVQSQCKHDKSKYKVTVSSCVRLEFKEEEDIKYALNEYGPLAIGLDSVPLYGYKGGVKIGAECKFKNLNHLLLLVGYGTEDGKPYWLIKNSWPQTWGETGYLKLSRGEGACGIGKEVTAVVIQ